MRTHGTNGTGKRFGGMAFMLLALAFGHKRVFYRRGHAIRVYRFAGRAFTFA